MTDNKLDIDTDKVTPEPLDSESEQVLRRDQIALQVVLDHKPKLHVNTTKVPLLGLPLSRGDPKVESEEDTNFWPLRHSRVKAEIAELLYSSRKIVLFEQDITRILTILEGIAWKNQIPETGFEQALDENPLVEAIYIFLMQPEIDGGFDGSCTKLLEDLKKIGKRKGVDINSKYWPTGPAQLSKKLVEQGKQLEKFGIEVTRGRRAGGDRFVTLSLSPTKAYSWNCDDAENTASQRVSIDKSHHPKAFHKCDAAGDDLSRRMKNIEN